jgi:hypothetical protein
MLGEMYVAIPAGGTLLYSAVNTASQFTWVDRAGKPEGLVGDPGEYTTFRLSPDGTTSKIMDYTWRLPAAWNLGPRPIRRFGQSYPDCIH